MDKLIGQRIFKPLGIEDWSWSLDRSGNPHGMSGLQIRPEDLVKIGQLMLDEGKWKGKQILPNSFVKQCVSDMVPKPSDTSDVNFENTPPKELLRRLGHDPSFRPGYGLLWWVNDEAQVAVTDRLLRLWKSKGVDETFLAKMTKLKNLTGNELSEAMKKHFNESEFFEHIVEKGLLDWDVLSWKHHGFGAEGFLGQYLVVVPEHKLVCVRMRRAPKGDFDERKIDSFRDFKTLVRSLGDLSK